MDRQTDATQSGPYMPLSLTGEAKIMIIYTVLKGGLSIHYNFSTW